jgi:cyanophycinase
MKSLNSKTGAIVLIGGAEDKWESRDVLSETRNLNDAKRVAIIPSASGYPVEVYEEYRAAFLALGADRVDLVDVRRRDETKLPAHHATIQAAELIFFTGGDQERLVRIFGNTSLLAAIKSRYAAGVTLAGTSAGSSAMGNPMIFDGNGTKGFQKRHVASADGFGLLDRLIIDTHFMERGRIPRLSQAVAAHPDGLGIGLGEDTGGVVTPDGRMRIIGNRVVAVIGGEEMGFTNYSEAAPDEAVAADGLRLSFLTRGMVFDLNRRRVVSEQKDGKRRGGRLRRLLA